MPLNAFSVDLEEWYHAEVVRRLRVEPVSQAEEATGPILTLLAEARVRATFFVVGEVMEASPDLVRRIRDAGHEVACHGVAHRPLWTMSEEELRRDLARFADAWRSVLGDGQPVGYRAPTFSLNQDTRWALGVLREFGYRYDSSVFPARMPLYGVSGAPLAPYRPSTVDLRRSEPNGALWEFPMSVCPVLGVRVPVAGGVYLRLLPYRVLRWLLRKINRQRPFVIYLHPWEVYPHTPRVPGLPLMERIGTYAGARRGLRKVSALLQDFVFAPVGEVLGLWPA